MSARHGSCVAPVNISHPVEQAFYNALYKKEKKGDRSEKRNEKRNCAIVIYGGSRLRVFRLCLDGGISFKRAWISEYGHHVVSQKIIPGSQIWSMKIAADLSRGFF